MDSYSRVFVRIFTVLLIHEVVFCGCNSLKIETSNRAIKSNTDEYQRKERQAPIDPSRMYLPPKIDAVASSGFGGQVDASNNFGDNINGYGEIGLVQDTTYNKGLSAEDSSYDVSTKATNNLESDGQTTVGSYDTGTTSGSGGSSTDQSTSYNIFAPEGNNFGQNPNKNNEYKIDTSSPGTSNYGSSLDPKSTPSNTDVATQTSSANGHRQDELLNTAQSQGIIQNNYNKLTEERKFGHTPGVDKQYDREAIGNAASGYDDNIASSLSKTALQDSSRNGGQNVYDRQRNNGNIGFSENTRFSENGGYGNTASNSFDQKPTSGDYGSNGNTGYSYERPSIDFAGFSSLSPNLNNQNNPSKSAPQINNENYGSTWSTQSSQLGEYNQREASASKDGPFSNDRLNQGASASTQSHENNFNGKPNTGCYSQNLKNTNSPPGELSGQLLPNNNNIRFEQNPANLCNQKPSEINGNKIGSTSFASSQGLSSVDSNNGLQAGQSHNSYSSREYSKINQKGSLNYGKEFNSNQQQSLTGESNDYGRSGTNSLRNGGNYAQNGLANNEYSNRGTSSNAFGGFDQQNQQPSNDYRQSGPQSLVNGGNYIHSSSTAPGNDGEYGRGSPNSFGQNSPSTSQIPTDYGRAGSRVSSGDDYGHSGPVSSGNGGHDQRGSSNRSNGVEQPNASVTARGDSNDRGSATGRQTLPPIEANYGGNGLSSPANNGGHAQGNSVGSSRPYGIDDAIGQIPPGSGTYNRNSYAQTYAASRNGLHTATGGSGRGSPDPLSGHHGHAFKGTCATVCRTETGRNVLSGSASAGSSAGNRNQKKYSTLVPKDQYQNSNLPSRGVFEKQGKESHPNNVGNNGGPVLNSFSNFTPASPLDRPPPVDNGEPGANSFSNFAPGNPPNQSPAIDNDQPGANSFSNFAPGSLPNLLPPAFDNGGPGANSFSNFAPGNLPNRPAPVDNDQPGANSFSNFAPGNPSNRPPPVDNDQPGANAFSNFAPGNLPNRPPPAPTDPGSGNNCGKSHGNDANGQTTEGVFPSVGY